MISWVVKKKYLGGDGEMYKGGTERKINFQNEKIYQKCNIFCMDKLVVLVTCKAKINKSLKVSELFAFFISRNKNILFRFPMKMFSMESTLPPT